MNIEIEKMTRITISEELEQKLSLIKSSIWNIKFDRGLESTVGYLVDQYEVFKDVSGQIKVLENKILEIIDKKIEEGVTKALKKVIQNILAF